MAQIKIPSSPAAQSLFLSIDSSDRTAVNVLFILVSFQDKVRQLGERYVGPSVVDMKDMAVI